MKFNEWQKLFQQKLMHQKKTSANFIWTKDKLWDVNGLYLTCFLVIFISPLIAIRICNCFVKHWPKQKHSPLYTTTSNKLEDIDVNNII